MKVGEVSSPFPSTSSGQAVPKHDPSTQKVMNEKKEARW